MNYLLTHDNPLAGKASIKRLRVWITVLSGTLAIALWMRLEASHPGTITDLPSILNDVGTAIGAVIRDFAYARAHELREFIRGTWNFIHFILESINSIWKWM